MSFINPFFLYLLPLAIIPVLIHLIGRQRYYRHEFSTLRFLKQLESDLIRRLKIRQILLLILRTLLIILLILIFARPYRSTESPGIYVGKGETLFLVVDNSLSMQIRNKGRRALERAKLGLSSASAEIDYPVYVKVLESVRPENVRDYGLLTGPDEFESILNSINESNRRGSIHRCLRTIKTAIDRVNERNVPVWIASDFQQGDVQSTRLLTDIIDQLDCRFIFFPVRSDPGNAAVASISVPGQLFRQNQALQVRGVVSNWNNSAREVPVSLFLDRQKLGQALISIPALDERFISFEFIPSNPGIQRVRMQINDDELLSDNQRYFTLNISDKINVLIVSRNPRDARVINRALQADKPELIHTKMTSAALFPTEDLSAYDLLIFSNVDELSESARIKLNFYLNLNRSMLLFPGDDCTPERFNMLWANTYGFPKWRTTRTAEQGQYLKLGEFDDSHPVFRQLLRSDTKIDYSPEFYTIPGFSIGKDQHSISLYEDNTPFIIETNSDVRGILMATSPMAGWSNLQLTGYFAAIMNRLVIYLSQQGTIQAELACGDTLSISPAQLNIHSELTLRTPDDRRIKLALGSTDPILFTDTDNPGFYSLFSKAQHIREYAVNAPESETDSRFLNDAELEKMISDHAGQMDLFYIGEENDLRQLEHSRELSSGLIVILLIVALLETYLGRINRKFRSRLQND